MFHCYGILHPGGNAIELTALVLMWPPSCNNAGRPISQKLHLPILSHLRQSHCCPTCCCSKPSSPPAIITATETMKGPPPNVSAVQSVDRDEGGVLMAMTIQPPIVCLITIIEGDGCKDNATAARTSWHNNQRMTGSNGCGDGVDADKRWQPIAGGGIDDREERDTMMARAMTASNHKQQALADCWGQAPTCAATSKQQST